MHKAYFESFLWVFGISDIIQPKCIWCYKGEIKPTRPYSKALSGPFTIPHSYRVVKNIYEKPPISMSRFLISAMRGTYSRDDWIVRRLKQEWPYKGTGRVIWYYNLPRHSYEVRSSQLLYINRVFIGGGIRLGTLFGSTKRNDRPHAFQYFIKEIILIRVKEIIIYSPSCFSGYWLGRGIKSLLFF